MYQIEETDPKKIALQKENERTQQTLAIRLYALKMFWAKLFKLKIKPKDERTVQKHPNASGGIDYYIKSPILPIGARFSSVYLMPKDGQRYAYKGISSADNAIGVLESNVPLDEIVSSPYGNEALQSIISEENATVARDNYYKSKGLPTEPLEGHLTHFSNPTFALGTILRDEKGRYSYYSTISDRTEQILQNERDEDAEMSRLRDSKAVEVEISPGWVVAKQDCVLIPDNKGGTGIAGTNSEAIPYKYTGLNTTKTEKGEYHITIGDLRLGNKSLTSVDGKVDFSKSYLYHNAVLYTTGDNIIHYCLNKGDNEINFALGELFTLYRMNRLEADEKGQLFIGGITLDEDGKAKVINDVPEVVKKIAQNMAEKGIQDKIIEFGNQ